MGLRLPYCRACGGVLVPVLSIYEEGRPHGTTGHNLTYRCAGISECRACGAAQVEKVSHDCFQFDEPWDFYLWLVLEPADATSLRQAVMSCPRATRAGCQCSLHQSLLRSARVLPCPEWHGLAIPEFAREETLAANTKRGVLSTTGDGLAIALAGAS